MSNRLVYDPLLVHHLAHELDRELRGRACASTPIFSHGASALLPLEGQRALRLDLHPERGWIRLVPAAAASDDLDAICTGVGAVRDERLITVHLRTGDRFRVEERELVLELHTNQWNALLVNTGDRRILAALRSRTAGDRVLRPGHPYRPPPPAHRLGREPITREEARRRWTLELGSLEPSARRAALIRAFAFTGTVNAEGILGRAAHEPGAESLDGAFARWWDLLDLDGAAPVLLHRTAGPLPYPTALPGMEAESIPSLLVGMARVAVAEERERPVPDDLALVLQRMDARIAAVSRRISSLRAQRVDPGEVDRLRSYGDLLLSNLRLVPRGADRVRLMGWDRKIVEIDLDPSLSGAENASRWYAEAKRRARADEKLPALISRAEGEMARWSEARAAAERGEPPDWALEELERGTLQAETGTPADHVQSLPYRLYRTAGGIEVRVGRGAKENDRLTFAHSSPNDVWLHARSVPGSHVIMRWNDPTGAPPARDLEEAATLAALYSKARTSALVPVDWTRRKHVRKPRGAPAGAVIPQRVRTVFVSPDPEVEERLRR